MFFANVIWQSCVSNFTYFVALLLFIYHFKSLKGETAK